MSDRFKPVNVLIAVGFIVAGAIIPPVMIWVMWLFLRS